MIEHRVLKIFPYNNEFIVEFVRFQFVQVKFSLRLRRLIGITVDISFIIKRQRSCHFEKVKDGFVRLRRTGTIQFVCHELLEIVYFHNSSIIHTCISV